MSAAKKKVIAVSLDVNTTRQVGKIVSPIIDLTTVSNAVAAMSLVDDMDVSAIIVDTQSGLDAMQLLESVRERKADVRRILVTDVENLAGIIQGLHSGTVQRVVYKPMTPQAIVAAVCATQKAA